MPASNEALQTALSKIGEEFGFRVVRIVDFDDARQILERVRDAATSALAEETKPFVAMQFGTDLHNVGSAIAALHPEEQARMLLGYLKSVKSYHQGAIGEAIVWDSEPDARTTAPRLLREIAEYIEKGH